MTITGKYVVVTDSLCDGTTADKDSHGRIILYTEDGAAREVMDSISFLYEGLSYEDCGLTPETVNRMIRLSQNGTAKQIGEFLDAHDVTDRDMSWEPAEGYIEGRKAMWTANGGHIEGTKIEDMEVVDA